MHIMLFGGAFDPPHIGHQQIAQTIIERKITDQVWFIPCYSHPFAKHMSPPQHRLAMITLMESTHILVNDYEIQKKGTSYSYDTLTHFQTSQPQHRFSWLIGSDQLINFHKWNQYQDLLNATTIYVYPRQHYPFDPMYEHMIVLKDFPLIAISSTKVRAKVRDSGNITNLVPEAVARYINLEKLYTT